MWSFLSTKAPRIRPEPATSARDIDAGSAEHYCKIRNCRIATEDAQSCVDHATFYFQQLALVITPIPALKGRYDETCDHFSLVSIRTTACGSHLPG